MKDEYILYLDESEFKTSKTFAIAGFAIRKDVVQLLHKEMYEIKKLIWTEDYIRDNNPVLHCTELQKLYAGRNLDELEGVRPEYQGLIKMDAEEIEKLYHQIYGRMALVLKKTRATVFSCIVKLQQLQDLFFIDAEHNGVHLIDDKYNIALQKVIENYTHYLSVCDGYGDVVYESRNSTGENSAKSPDVKLINDYHKIQANNRGIVYTDSVAVQGRNRTIQVYGKNDDLAGLQIADFIAYNIIKLEKCNISSQITDFMKLIHRLSYNGGHTIEERDQRSFWGMRVLPSYLKMEELISSNKSLKNAMNNLKKERSKLKKSIESQEERIEELQKQVSGLELELCEIKKHNIIIDSDENN